MESATLLNSQLGFLNSPLALIHIPLSSYPLFVQPIAQLLLSNTRRDNDGNMIHPFRPWAYWYPFVNISVTPTGCSIVCPREEAERHFRPIVNGFGLDGHFSASISDEGFSAITISGEGLEAGQRVIDLTSPLAMAGIPIFFITSYWADFILVPLDARIKVIQALEKRGFVFHGDDLGEVGYMCNPASPILQQHRRDNSTESYFTLAPKARTPPPTNVYELQTKTFEMLQQHHISPYADATIELVTCAAAKDTTTSSSLSNFTEGKLQLGLVKCLTSSTPPRFFSLTLTDAESASLMIEKRLLPLFFHDGEDLLLGKDGPEQVAITLDLHKLPLESTGIVCGVASRLIEGMRGRVGKEVFNMSYLSAARAGYVIVYADELEDAMQSLRGAESNGAAGSRHS